MTPQQEWDGEMAVLILRKMKAWWLTHDRDLFLTDLKFMIKEAKEQMDKTEDPIWAGWRNRWKYAKSLNAEWRKEYGL